MNHIDGIVKLAENEFEAIVKNGKFRSREEIDSVYKLMDIVKDAKCIEKYEDEEFEMYEGSYDDGYGRSMRGSYNDNSYARGRRNVRRDSMGRYSRDGYDREAYRGGSYNRGYSRDGEDEYKEQLRSMMENAPDEQTRQSIKRMIDQMA